MSRRIHQLRVRAGLALAVLIVAGCATATTPAALPTPHPSPVPAVAPTRQPTPAPPATTLPTPAPTIEPTPEPPPVAEILDPLAIPKYVDPLIIPPVMPSEGQRDWNGEGEVATEYRVAIRQFAQQVLPTGFPETTVWGYGRVGDPLPAAGGPSSFNFPGFTIEARTDELVRVVWVNQLVDDPDSAAPRFLPHILPVDQALHWANPAGPADGHGQDPSPYRGPIPMVTHVHGAHVPAASDGYPEAWYLPSASDIPENYIHRGSFYGSAHPAPAGAAVFEYPNDQRAMTLWYHDHSLGITRLNVYAGLAGFWILRDDVEDSLNLPGPAPRLGDPAATSYYEVPIVIQDRTFRTDGSLFYPDSRAFFDEYGGPYFPDSQVPPLWNPEFFGNTMVVNGRTWPYLEVEPRLYRFRFLNGANSRFLILRFDQALPFHQIGNEGGLLPGQPLVLDELLLAPAERADVIVDFSAFQPGDTIVLFNLGPDAPFGSLPVDPEERADPETTGQVMQFRVVEMTEQGNPGVIPTTLPPIDPLTTTLPVRDITLNEKMDPKADIPIEAQMGTIAEGPLDWEDDITESPIVGDTEIWRITNLTEDAHPVHLHLVHFQVLDRTPFDKEAFQEAHGRYLASGGTPPDPFDFAIGDPLPAFPWEQGWKETVIANPGMVTRIIATFDLPGLYVWHCHILEHEDNEMMRPYYVRPR